MRLLGTETSVFLAYALLLSFRHTRAWSLSRGRLFVTLGL